MHSLYNLSFLDGEFSGLPEEMVDEIVVCFDLFLPGVDPAWHKRRCFSACFLVLELHLNPGAFKSESDIREYFSSGEDGLLLRFLMVTPEAGRFSEELGLALGRQESGGKLNTSSQIECDELPKLNKELCLS